jgi:hypothetical protein
MSANRFVNVVVMSRAGQHFCTCYARRCSGLAALHARLHHNDVCIASALLLLLLQEGLAHLCLVGSSTTLVRAKIEANLPRKRGPAIAGYDRAWDKFMDQVRPAGGQGWVGGWACTWPVGMHLGMHLACEIRQTHNCSWWQLAVVLMLDLWK